MNVTDKIIQRIKAKRRGWVFTPKNFLDLGTRAAVDKILSRLVQCDLIRRIDRGIYDYPKYSKILEMDLSPHINDIARVVADRSGHTIFHSGAMSANLLGLSTQVPAKLVYLTNGTSRIKQVGDNEIIFKHARVPLLNDLSYSVNLTIQALSHIGKDHINEDVIRNCSRQLVKSDKVALTKAAPYVPAWMVSVIHQISMSSNG